MDSEKSLIYINDFERRISLLSSDPQQEAWIRELLRDVLVDCPTSVLTKIATCVLDIRKAELSRSQEQN